MSISTTSAARKMAAARKTHAGGRPAKRTRCAKCGEWCDSAREARAHCKGREKASN